VKGGKSVNSFETSILIFFQVIGNFLTKTEDNFWEKNATTAHQLIHFLLQADDFIFQALIQLLDMVHISRLNLEGFEFLLSLVASHTALSKDNFLACLSVQSSGQKASNVLLNNDGFFLAKTRFIDLSRSSSSSQSLQTDHSSQDKLVAFPLLETSESGLNFGCSGCLSQMTVVPVKNKNMRKFLLNSKINLNKIELNY
jgi:hypothetical protein